MAITATSEGNIIIWNQCEALCKENEIKTDRRKIKTVQLLKYKKDEPTEKDIINVLINYEKYIVIGTGERAIKFYNYDFIIERWFENVSWLVNSISFDMDTWIIENYLNSPDLLNDIGKEKDKKEIPFCMPFLVADIAATITRVYNTESVVINKSDDNVDYLEAYRGLESPITSIALHPKIPLLAVATDGTSERKKRKEKPSTEFIIKDKKFEFRPYVQLFYYPDHMKLIREEKMELKQKQNNLRKSNIEVHNLEYQISQTHYKVYLEVIPTVVEFSADGKFLLIGTNDGKIYVYPSENLKKYIEPVLLLKEVTEEDKKSSISEIIFSPDEKHFGVIDNMGRIGLFQNENPYTNL